MMMTDGIKKRLITVKITIPTILLIIIFLQAIIITVNSQHHSDEEAERTKRMVMAMPQTHMSRTNV